MARLLLMGRSAAVLLWLPLLVSAQRTKPPSPPTPVAPDGGHGGSSCVDVLTWPCWMVGNASDWNKDDSSGGSYTLRELCVNNRFTWAGSGVENSPDDVGPTLRAKDACCICQPDTVGTPQPEDPASTAVATIVEARRPYGSLFVEEPGHPENSDKNRDIA